MASTRGRWNSAGTGISAAAATTASCSLPGWRSPITPRIWRLRPKRPEGHGEPAAMLWLFHRLMDIGWVYRLAQVFGRPTVRRYRMLVEKHVPQSSERPVLEIGSGIGSSRPLFQADYTGIDINSDYIRIARQTMTGAFEVMDAAQMSFAPDSFDDAVSIATGHHLSDDQLVSMIRKATNVAATLHIIGSILPVSPHAY